eukprot:373749-Alexandrium_andersonii.AAC.1
MRARGGSWGCPGGGSRVRGAAAPRAGAGNCWELEIVGNCREAPLLMCCWPWPTFANRKLLDTVAS